MSRPDLDRHTGGHWLDFDRVIGILHENDRDADAGALASALQRAVADLVIERFKASQPMPWPQEPEWSDVLLVLFAHPDLPEPARQFVSDFRERRALMHGGRTKTGGFVLPVALPGADAKPPAPISGVKSLPLDPAYIQARIEVLLGAAPNRRDQLVFVSYRNADGRRIAEQLHQDLEDRGFAAWLDEAEENLQGGDDVQQRIDTILERATALVLVDTPRAPASEWIRHEIARAHGQMIPVLPVVIGEPRTTRFIELKDLRRDVLLRKDGFRDEPLLEAELQSVRDGFDELMTDVYRRRQLLLSRAEKVFTDHGYTWATADARRRMFVSEKVRRPLPALRVLSHCSIHDVDYGGVAAAVRSFRPANECNHRLLVYESRSGPLTDRDIDFLVANPAFQDLILVHHQELSMLVGSSFARLR